MLKNRQQQQLEQRQTLTARQIQQIQLLELPVTELEQRISAEIERNPALEEGYTARDDSNESNATNEQVDSALSQSDQDRLEARNEFGNDDEIPAYRLRMIAEREQQREEIPFAAHGLSLTDYLDNQLSTLELTERQQLLAPYIVGNLREDGYLDRSLPLIAQDLLLKEGVDASEQELTELLQIIQSLDPPGVGARTLQECLLLQLHRMEQSETVVNAEKIVSRYFDDFAYKRFERLTKRGFDQKQLEEVSALIHQLSPKPGNGFDSSAETLLSKVTPDFIITEHEGELTLTLTDQREIPALTVSPSYKQMIADYRDASTSERAKLKETIQYTRDRVKDAEWFISALQQRYDTLRTTMTIIMTLQRDFFLSGDIVDLRPMILKDVAELARLDISTISRVSNSKYVQCQWGIYPVKFFFSESMQAKDGSDVSTKVIKDCLKQIIEGEDPRQPLTDDQLTEALSQQGYDIARRTTAKYRQQLGLPTARLRRKLTK